MKKSIFTLSTLGLALAFFAGSAFAAGTASSKFAATWNTDMGLGSVAVINDATTDTNIDPDGNLIRVDRDMGYTMATIKIPQDKELLVGVSAEIGIVTYGAVKGKNGGSARAIADGEAYVTVFAVPRDGGDSIEAAPGQIILSKRVQELSATLGGVIQSCDVNCTTELTDTDGDGIPDTALTTCDDIVVADDCVVTDEEISLLLNTTAAHHFNFVLPNLPQGVYDIKAVFTTGASVGVDICDEGEDCMYDPEGTVSASAEASAVINKTMVTVQQVRAAKGGVIDATDLQ